MPSDKILKRKQKAVSALANELREAESVVFSNYQGLTVAQDTAMRKAFRDENLNYRVAKNTKLLRAFQELGIEDLEDILAGPTAIAWSNDDVTSAPRLVKKFVDEFKKTEIKGGIIDGKLVELDKINALASIPSIEVLHGQLVSSLIFPVTSLAMTLSALAKKAEENGVEDISKLAGQAKAEPVAEEEASPREAATEEEPAPAADAPAEEPAANAEAETASEDK